jgi:hypothetical protein
MEDVYDRSPRFVSFKLSLLSPYDVVIDVGLRLMLVSGKGLEAPSGESAVESVPRGMSRMREEVSQQALAVVRFASGSSKGWRSHFR